MNHPRRHLPFLLLVVSTTVGCGLNTAVLKTGGTGRTGTLLNYSCGARPCDAIDPSKPTIVITHGMNPLPNLMHTSLGESGARALKCRCGCELNILSWDWNAVHVPPLRRSAVRIGKEQGRKMAAALRARGVDPTRTQFIAHSLGTLVAAQAAACLADRGPVAQITLLDAPKIIHPEIFDELAVTCHTFRLENYWAPGISGFGAKVCRRDVQNFRIEGTTPLRGMLDLSLSNHVNTMRWYYRTMVDPSLPCGFQNSMLLGACCENCQSCAPVEEIVQPTPTE